MENGDRVRYVGCGDEETHFAGCDDPRQMLQEGAVYVVNQVVAHTWHTKISLVDVPDSWFNSVVFE